MEQKVVEQFFCWYETAEYVADYDTRRASLKALFDGYRSATGQDKAIMDWMLTAHARYCKQQGKPADQRKHNAFVLRYVAGISEREIGRNMNISMRTVFRDISDVIENMMVLAFGVYGLQPQKSLQRQIASNEQFHVIQKERPHTAVATVSYKTERKKQT